jgi:para-aminobenzoate synthetase/4-amino-4-deoxychorismate lyase
MGQREQFPSHGVLLETGRPDSENSQTLFFRDPKAVLVANRPDQLHDLLSDLDDFVAKGFFAAGYLAYEAGAAFERVDKQRLPDTPIAWFGVFDEPSVLDTNLSPGAVSSQDRTDFDPRFSLSRSEYAERVRRVKTHLHEGDVYQINLTGRFAFDYEDRPEDLYRVLRSRQPVAYNALIVTDKEAIVSCSPELFFRRDGDQIWTRPMKGTVRRGKDPLEDEVLAQWLASDPKSRAENLMIVDLLRNDLSRVCVRGSVEVPRLFTPEVYETVIQLTSTVTGRLAPQTRYADIFRALFPCGSVTGAPKPMAMQIINQLERTPRGIYTGIIGYIAPDNRAVFSVAIRTVSIREGRAVMGSGGGIVWDSDTHAEYRECMLKASFLTGRGSQPDLIETMLWNNGVTHLDAHLSRMQASAIQLGYPFEEQVIRDAVARETSELVDGFHRVRLLLHPDGQFSVQIGRHIESMSPGPVKISEITMDSTDPWLQHKSSRRELYDAEYARAVSEGYVEVLFFNERGELTEGSRTNVILEMGDELKTPPLSSGALPGTTRARLLTTTANLSEAVLSREDLESADRILLCNAAIGLVPVHLTTRT